MAGKIGRNDSCWCGSGRKYKSCHMAFDERIARAKAEGHIVPKRDIIKTPDGALYLISNPVGENWGERSPLTLQKSTDNGETWETVLVLEEEKIDSEFSYPAIEYMNGSLYITYTYERINVAFWKIEL